MARELTRGEKWFMRILGAVAIFALCMTFRQGYIVLTMIGEQNRIERYVQETQYAWVQNQLDTINRENAIKAMLDEDAVDLQLVQQAQKQKPADPVKCLTDNIYFEAGFEPYEGQLAVAQVTLNRAHEDKRNICTVVYYKKVNPATHKKEAAFSWTLGKKWRPKGINRKAYGECKQLAQAVLTKGLRSDIIDQTVEYYAATYVHPRWADQHEVVTTIGQHIFYR